MSGSTRCNHGSHGFAAIEAATCLVRAHEMQPESHEPRHRPGAQQTKVVAGEASLVLREAQRHQFAYADLDCGHDLRAPFTVKL